MGTPVQSLCRLDIERPARRRREDPNSDAGNLDPRTMSGAFPLFLKKWDPKSGISPGVAGVFTEDSLLYMNRDTSALISPDELATRRGVSVFRRTAVQSLGDYLGANYHPNGIIGFFREAFLDDSSTRELSLRCPRLLRGIQEWPIQKRRHPRWVARSVDPNPRGFVTFSDKAEIDVTAHNPSFILRNPVYGDGHALITALAVEYPDWQVDKVVHPQCGAQH